VVMTPSRLPSGSDRVAYVLKKRPEQWVLMTPRVSPDGTKVGVMSLRQSDGTFGEWPWDMAMWTVDLVSGELEHVVDLGYRAGFDFFPDGSSVIYGDAVSCSSDLHRFDLATGADEVVYDVFEVAEFPDINPTDPTLVAYDHLECAVGSTAMVADLDALAPMAVPDSGPPEGEPPRGHTGGWDSTGSRLAYWTQEAVRVWELGSDRSELVLSLDGGQVHRPIFGPGDDYLILRLTPAGSDVHRLHRLDLETLELTPIGIETLYSYDWGSLPAEIDRDGDGIANGFDGSPDP